jgi:hypothetical protein
MLVGMPVLRRWRATWGELAGLSARRTIVLLASRCSVPAKLGHRVA